MKGSISKKETAGELLLERKILGRRDLLILKRDRCNGCGICAEVCPKASVDVKPGVIENSRLSRFPEVYIDTKTCIMCGMCAVFCPLGALVAWVNDEKTAMLQKEEALPRMIKTIEVNPESCSPDCGIECEKSCPREAIKVSVEKDDNQVQKILDIQVEADLCIYCKGCEYACPYGAFSVNKFLEGSMTIETEKCPQNCQVCVDICPSNAARTSREGTVDVVQELCIFCKACQNACPREAILVAISRVSHTPIKSATWITVLERFASYQAGAKELSAKSRRNLRLVVEGR